MKRTNTRPPSHALWFFISLVLIYIEPLESEETQKTDASRKMNFTVVDTYFNKFLDQGTTLSILHTSNDRLWISNYEGVFKARGKYIRGNNQLFGKPVGLSKIRIRGIIEAWEGKIIALTYSNHMLLYDDNMGHFEPPSWLNTNGLQNGNISKAFFSESGVLWIGYMNGDVVEVHDDGTIYRDIAFKFKDPIADFQEDEKNGFIIIADHRQILRFNLSSRDFDIFDVKNECGVKSPVQEIASLPSGEIWIGTAGSGLFFLDPDKIQCSSVAPGISTEKDFQKSTIHEITYDEETDTTIVSSDQGIFIFESEFSAYNFTTGNSKLLNNEVISLTSDHSGGYWVGTYNGINKLVISPFELLDKKRHEGLQSVFGFQSKDQDQIVVATYGGLLVTDIGSTKFSRFQDQFPNIKIHGERIMAAYSARDKIYLGYRNHGFEVIDLQNSLSFRWDTETLNSLNSNSVSSFLDLGNNDILVGTYGGGLTLFRENGDSRSLTSGDSNNALRDDRILMLRKSSEGTVWVGTESGLQIFDQDKEIFKDAIFSSDTSNKGDQPLVWNMAESDDYLWFGSLHHGLFRLSKSDYAGDFSVGGLKKVEINHTLSGMAIYAIEAGSGNEIWFSTNRGIAQLGNDGVLFNFGRTYGLQETEFELGSSYKDHNGLIYFGGNHGYNRFDPSTVNASRRPPEVVLNSIVLDNRGSETYLTSPSLESVVLSHKDLFITFEFSALDYTDPENTRYRHKLVGFDTDWVDIGNRDSATYTSLPPGEYVFRVQAMNSAGIWNYDGLTVGLEVMPAPWNTWWAKTLYALAAIVILAGAFRYQRNNMLRDQDLARTKEMQRMADRVADDLQDQMEFQANFSNSMDHYNKQLLYWTKFCTDTTAEYEPANTSLAYDRIRFRLDVLSLIQDSLFYRGEQLYAELPRFVNLLVKKFHDENPEGCERLNSVNNVEGELVPAAQAIPIAIIFAELFDNSLKHAFALNSESRFIRFSLTITPNTSFNSDTFHLVYQDNGYGIPPGLSFESPESAGFAIIQHAAERLRGEIEISEQDRNLISASFNLPWTQRRP